MKFVPKTISRFGHRSLLKVSANSPTILVVAGVVGMGATAILAARATRNIDPVVETHTKKRQDIKNASLVRRDEQRELLQLYVNTGKQFGLIYGPTIIVGTISAASILYGHKVLHGRHMASIAAYTGLMEQFHAYRGRIAQTLGEDVERGIYEGARGEWVEDPDHKGEYKLEPKFDPEAMNTSYLRPWFDERCANWKPDATANRMFLSGVQQHMNDLLQIRGHVTLNDVYDALRIPRTNEGQVAGWVWNSKVGDNFIDFGFMTGIDPATLAFRNGLEKSVRLNFNIQGNIYGLI